MVDRWVRRRYGSQLSRTPLRRFHVRVARQAEEYIDAFRLLSVAYMYQGYQTMRRPEMRITAQHVLPEATVFVAYEGDQMVGTVTVTADSPAGLPLDEDFGEELSKMRQSGARPVEIGSLAVVRRCWSEGVSTLLNIAAHWFTTHHLKASHCVIGINPKAAPLYRALFGFRPLASCRTHADLNAPVIGMVQELAAGNRFIARHLRGYMESGFRLCEHFTSEPLDCIEMPPLADTTELARWKLSREVFRQLFIDESSRLATLDSRTRHHLCSLRTVGTTQVEAMDEEARHQTRRLFALTQDHADGPPLPPDHPAAAPSERRHRGN